MSEAVDIDDLRRNLGDYLARIARGESFELTDRGQSLGRLVPASTGESWLDTLVAEGRVRPARYRSKVFPRPAPMVGSSISDSLESDRSDRML